MVILIEIFQNKRLRPIAQIFHTGAGINVIFCCYIWLVKKCHRHLFSHCPGSGNLYARKYPVKWTYSATVPYFHAPSAGPCGKPFWSGDLSLSPRSLCIPLPNLYHRHFPEPRKTSRSGIVLQNLHHIIKNPFPDIPPELSLSP